MPPQQNGSTTRPQKQAPTKNNAKTSSMSGSTASSKEVKDYKASLRNEKGSDEEAEWRGSLE